MRAEILIPIMESTAPLDKILGVHKKKLSMVQQLASVCANLKNFSNKECLQVFQAIVSSDLWSICASMLFLYIIP